MYIINVKYKDKTSVIRGSKGDCRHDLLYRLAYPGTWVDEHVGVNATDKCLNTLHTLNTDGMFVIDKKVDNNVH